MPTRNVNLTEHLDCFIEDRIKSGSFSNASEVVREGLRLLEQRELENKAKLDWFRFVAKEGFDDKKNGDYIALRSEADIHNLVERVRHEVSGKMDAGTTRNETSET